MKKRHLENHVVLLVVILVLLSFFMYLTTVKSLMKAPGPTPTPYPTKEVVMEKYESDLLNLSVEYPTDLTIEEKYTDIVFQKNAININLSRIGTSYDNLSKYLNDLSTRNSYVIDFEQEYKQGDLSVVTGRINGDKIYFIYANHWVYTLSTSSPELYDELDQIARSFRYIP